mgnify:CR=1 FL=1
MRNLIAYAKRYHFYIINDNAYSDIVFTEGSGIFFPVHSRGKRGGRGVLLFEQVLN